MVAQEHEPTEVELTGVLLALVMCMYVATLGRWLVQRRCEDTPAWEDFLDRLVEALHS